MIFCQLFRKDCFRYTSMAVFVLSLIVFAIALNKALNQAAFGGVLLGHAFPISVFSMISFLPTVITVSLCFGVLMTVTQSCVQSEMVAWLTCGQSLFGVIKPILQVAIPISLLLLGLYAWVVPWANLQSRLRERQVESEVDFNQLGAGRFAKMLIQKTEHILYIEALKENRGALEGRGVFVLQKQKRRGADSLSEPQGVEVLITGEKIKLVRPQQLLVFENGQRYGWQAQTSISPIYLGESRDKNQRIEGGVVREKTDKAVRPLSIGSDLSAGSEKSAISGDNIMVFQRYGMSLSSASPDNNEASALSLQALFLKETGLYKAELFWRFSGAILPIWMSLLMIPLSVSSPRLRQTKGFVWGILAYGIVLNGQGALQFFVGQQRISSVMALVLLSLAMLLPASILFRKYSGIR